MSRSGIAHLVFWLSVVAARPASSTVLTFDVVPIPSYLYAEYGDNVTAESMYWGRYKQGNAWTPDVTVSYASRRAADGSDACGCLLTWGGGYGDLGNVTYSAEAAGAYAEMTFDAPMGVQIRLNGFDVAGFNADQASQPVEVRDGNGMVLLSQSVDVLCCEPLSNPCVRTHVHVPLSVIAVPPVTLRVGLTWLAGLDNVDFDQAVAAPARATSWGAIKAQFRP